MTAPTTDPSAAVGDPEALDLLRELVALAPTNLEDPPSGRYEKPNYLATAERIHRAAVDWGLTATILDPALGPHADPELRSIPRPNVIVDLDVGAPRRVLLLAHYDVVPIPVEQRSRWKSPPHELTLRSDGRLYGRGSNDDLGSGVVASLLALRRLRAGPPPPVNLRLIACCDEETGGVGGIEALKAHDDALPEHDAGRLLLAESALIPDGHLHATAASSGVAFLDAYFPDAVPLGTALALGDALVALHDTARAWKSAYPSPDWPDHGASEPVITGRATVTKFDLSSPASTSPRVRAILARAESDAANQIAETVTLAFAGTGAGLGRLESELRFRVQPPFHLQAAVSTSLTIPPGAKGWQIVGRSAHGGSPHLGHNPVPAAIDLLRSLVEGGILRSDESVRVTYAVDLRLIPEMELAPGVNEILAVIGARTARHAPGAVVEAPAARARPGYALPIDHPVVVRMAGILGELMGVSGVVGEYGGTDASSLREVRTPSGEPIPAVVFGAMDRASNIHEAEESVDPKQLGAVARAI
ncbi:MAG: M20/M25/M40 family metallo-hydrolase, partial [Thermoplasmata archaeon]|nr:M20/M25/M40 family metallo-hydrolase [Thermoplasmata archaeon]